jgi:hypothetical protein
MVSRAGQDPTVRYVPLDIFELWKSHMAAAYGYDVTSESIGTWTAEAHGGAADDSRDEAVAEVTVTRRTGEIESQAERFFSCAELEMILPRFLAHYGIDAADPVQMAAVAVTPGRLIVPADAKSA